MKDHGVKLRPPRRYAAPTSQPHVMTEENVMVMMSQQPYITRQQQHHQQQLQQQQQPLPRRPRQRTSSSGGGTTWGRGHLDMPGTGAEYTPIDTYTPGEHAAMGHGAASAQQGKATISRVGQQKRRGSHAIVVDAPLGAAGYASLMRDDQQRQQQPPDAAQQQPLRRRKGGGGRLSVVETSTSSVPFDPISSKPMLGVNDAASNYAADVERKLSMPARQPPRVVLSSVLPPGDLETPRTRTLAYIAGKHGDRDGAAAAAAAVGAPPRGHAGNSKSGDHGPHFIGALMENNANPTAVISPVESPDRRYTLRAAPAGLRYETEASVPVLSPSHTTDDEVLRQGARANHGDDQHGEVSLPPQHHFVPADAIRVQREAVQLLPTGTLAAAAGLHGQSSADPLHRDQLDAWLQSQAAARLPGQYNLRSNTGSDGSSRLSAPDRRMHNRRQNHRRRNGTARGGILRSRNPSDPWWKQQSSRAPPGPQRQQRGRPRRTSSKANDLFNARRKEKLRLWQQQRAFHKAMAMHEIAQAHAQQVAEAKKRAEAVRLRKEKEEKERAEQEKKDARAKVVEARRRAEEAKRIFKERMSEKVRREEEKRAAQEEEERIQRKREKIEARKQRIREQQAEEARALMMQRQAIEGAFEAEREARRRALEIAAERDAKKKARAREKRRAARDLAMRAEIANKHQRKLYEEALAMRENGMKRAEGSGRGAAVLPAAVTGPPNNEQIDVSHSAATYEATNAGHSLSVSASSSTASQALPNTSSSESTDGDRLTPADKQVSKNFEGLLSYLAESCKLFSFAEKQPVTELVLQKLAASGGGVSRTLGLMKVLDSRGEKFPHFAALSKRLGDMAKYYIPSAPTEETTSSATVGKGDDTIAEEEPTIWKVDGGRGSSEPGPGGKSAEEDGAEMVWRIG